MTVYDKSSQFKFNWLKIIDRIERPSAQYFRDVEAVMGQWHAGFVLIFRLESVILLLCDDLYNYSPP